MKKFLSTLLLSLFQAPQNGLKGKNSQIQGEIKGKKVMAN